jgi:regulator of protease activity HflC (stomatin/prohibitin superfamily)
MPGILAAIALIFVGYLFNSVKIISQGYEALVERLGRFHRKLTPGLHFILPPIDRIVFQETIREKVLDVPPQQCITSDNVSLMADAVVYWRITDMIKARYAVEDVQRALINLVLTASARRNWPYGFGSNLFLPRRDQRPPFDRAGRGHRSLGDQDHARGSQGHSTL